MPNTDKLIRLEMERLENIWTQMEIEWLNGEWEKLSNSIVFSPELYEESFARFYNCLPDDLQRKTAIEAYMQHGDSFNAVCKAVTALAGRPTHGLYELPEELSKQEVIRVYRAGVESIDKASDCMSWTTDLAVAQWFQTRNNVRDWESTIYTGLIRTKDIIAYTDDRKEKEVIQYKAVYDIKKETELYDEKFMDKVEEILSEVHDRIIPDLAKLYDIATQTYEETWNQVYLVDALRVWYALADARRLEEKLEGVLSAGVSIDWLFSAPVQELVKKIEAEIAERRQQNGEEDDELPF